MNRRDAIYRVAGLMGASFSAPLLMGLSNFEKRNPQYLASYSITEAHKNLVEEIAELYIPETSTPGAKAAGVPDFVIMMIEECYAKDDKEKFYKGLDELNGKAKQQFGKEFLKATKDQQSRLLLSEEKQAQEKNYKEEPFIKMIKELTLFGYFTSEIGCTQALSYLPIPGRYDACVDMDKNQKTHTF